MSAKHLLKPFLLACERSGEMGQGEFTHADSQLANQPHVEYGAVTGGGFLVKWHRLVFVALCSALNVFLHFQASTEAFE